MFACLLLFFAKIHEKKINFSINLLMINVFAFGVFSSLCLCDEQFQYNPGPSTAQTLQQNPHLHPIPQFPHHLITSQSPLLNLNLLPQQPIQIHHVQHPLSRQQM